MITKRVLLLISLLLSMLLFSACGSSEEPASESGSSTEEQISEVSANQQPAADEAQQETQGEARLSDDFANALSIQGQLALGILQLEENDLAIDDSQAAELLPLWQVLQSLANSDTTAAVEIEAVVNQIQESMTAEQITTIADMQLTEESLTTMIESGDLAFGRGAAGGAGRGEAGDGGFGGFGGGLPGGGPGGGIAGGRGGGLGGGFGGGDLSEDAIATRRAEFSGDSFGDIQDQMLVGVVVRLLQQKSGETPERLGIFDTVFDVMSGETGLSVEEIRDLTADGATLAEIVATHGGDLDVVRAALIAAINELPNAAELDAEQMADQWLGLAVD